jgi:hypothetical protein
VSEHDNDEHRERAAREGSDGCSRCGRGLTSETGYVVFGGKKMCHPFSAGKPTCYGEELEAEKEDYRRRLKACDRAVADRNGEILALEDRLAEMTRLRDNALRQLNREDDEAPFELEELISQGIDAVIGDWEGDVPLERVIESIARALHPDLVKLQEAVRREQARAAQVIEDLNRQHEQVKRGLAERANEAKARLDAVVNEVFTTADAHRPADKRSPDYLYSLGRLEGFSQVRFAVLRGLGCFDPNHEVWIPFSRVEDVDLIRLAINDPGAFTEREKIHYGEYESLGQWGARAVLIALREGRGDR